MYGSDAGQPPRSLYTKGLSPLCDSEPFWHATVLYISVISVAEWLTIILYISVQEWLAILLHISVPEWLSIIVHISVPQWLTNTAH